MLVKSKWHTPSEVETLAGKKAKEVEAESYLRISEASNDNITVL